MAIINGVVKAKSNKYSKYSILIEETWYSSKFEIKAEIGDEVSFDDQDKRYVRSLTVTKAGEGVAPPSGGGYNPAGGAAATRVPGFPVRVDTKDRAIVRQNSLGHAVRLVAAMIEPPAYDTWEQREHATEEFATLAVGVARIFEDYSAGDGDSEAAKKLVEDTE